jgi:hypothetical protein
MSASRLNLEIEPSALERLLESDVLRLCDFSCADMETKRLVQAIYRQLATSKMRRVNSGE